MIAVVQRVKSASVKVDKKIISTISNGYLILLGISKDDIEVDAKFLADKIAKFRIFSDDKKNMNLSILDVEGSILVVSQFTLCSEWQKVAAQALQVQQNQKKLRVFIYIFLNFL